MPYYVVWNYSTSDQHDAHEVFAKLLQDRRVKSVEKEWPDRFSVVMAAAVTGPPPVPWDPLSQSLIFFEGLLSIRMGENFLRRSTEEMEPSSGSRYRPSPENDHAHKLHDPSKPYVLLWAIRDSYVRGQPAHAAASNGTPVVILNRDGALTDPLPVAVGTSGFTRYVDPRHVTGVSNFPRGSRYDLLNEDD